jgi:hypothetical protein
MRLLLQLGTQRESFASIDQSDPGFRLKQATQAQRFFSIGGVDLYDDHRHFEFGSWLQLVVMMEKKMLEKQLQHVRNIRISMLHKACSCQYKANDIS